MNEIAGVFKQILSNTRAAKITKGKNAGQMSKARYRIKDGALSSAKDQISSLLDRFTLYPEIDLEYLQKSFA